MARSKDKKVVRVVKEIKKAEVRVLRGNEQQINENLVLKEKKYVLKNEAQRVKIIWLHHNMSVAKYKERQKTTELVMRNY